MPTTSSSFTTRIRTWVLIAGLTALLLGIGAILGGAWLWLFAIGAVLFNVFGYWFSDRIALKASGARPLSETDAGGLYRVVRELATRAELPMPRLYLIPSEQPNAFATGRNPGHAAIAVTEGLLQHLPPDQVRGVLAHELAHVRNRDILVSSVAAMIAGAISGIANVLQLSFLFGDDEDNPLGFVGAIATMLLAPVAAMLLQLGISRQREFLADATAAKLLGEGRPLADALTTLERGRQAIPLQVSPANASLYIVNPLHGQGVAALFSTHPPIEERIRRLRAFDGAPLLRAA
jgi:heat shock protein HtpX